VTRRKKLKKVFEMELAATPRDVIVTAIQFASDHFDEYHLVPVPNRDGLDFVEINDGRSFVECLQAVGWGVAVDPNA
jgi:hypothetical protein